MHSYNEDTLFLGMTLFDDLSVRAIVHYATDMDMVEIPILKYLIPGSLEVPNFMANS